MIPLAIASARSRFLWISSYNGEEDEVTILLSVSGFMLGSDIPYRIFAASCLEFGHCFPLRHARLVMIVCRDHSPMLHASIQSHCLVLLAQRCRAVLTVLETLRRRSLGRACFQFLRDSMLYRDRGHGLVRPEKAAWSSPRLEMMPSMCVVVQDEGKAPGGRGVFRAAHATLVAL